MEVSSREQKKRNAIGHFNSEMPQASVLKRGQVQNLSYEIFFIIMQKTHFHKKGFALGLVLRVSVFGTRKWPKGNVKTEVNRKRNVKTL